MTSALIRAITDHDRDGIVRLLSRGMDPNAPDGDGRRPVHVAIREVDFGGEIEVIKLLLKYGANVNEPQRRVEGSPWDVFDEETPILLVCDRRTTSPLEVVQSSRIEVARLLLEAGADPNVRRADGESPLRLCVQARDLAMATLLLNYGADQTINEYGGGGGLALTALAYAASDFNVPMIQLLLGAGANPQTREECGETARDWLPPREECDPQLWDAAIELLSRSKGDEALQDT